LFTIPGIVLTLLGVLTLAFALPDDAIEIGDVTWQPIFAGAIFVVVGINALLLGFASRLYTTARGITNEDRTLRFYHKYLGFETFVMTGVVLVLIGIVVDIVIAIDSDLAVSTVGLMAIAQTLIIAGANIALVGALCSLLEGE
jgi:uncharacterized membrane protein